MTEKGEGDWNTPTRAAWTLTSCLPVFAYALLTAPRDVWWDWAMTPAQQVC